jgi:hypothetical protein
MHWELAALNWQSRDYFYVLRANHQNGVKAV